MRFWWVCWRQIQMWWITSWGEKHHSESRNSFTRVRSAVCLVFCFFYPNFHPYLPTGVQTCYRQRSPSPWVSAAPPATPTRRPAARCPRMTITPRSWVRGEENQGARAASSSSVSQNSTVWWGRWPAGVESLELRLGAPKVNLWHMSLWLFFPPN